MYLKFIYWLTSEPFTLVAFSIERFMDSELPDLPNKQSTIFTDLEHGEMRVVKVDWYSEGATEEHKYTYKVKVTPLPITQPLPNYNQ